MKRRAFTLMEVMVALVVTGLVVSLAYAAAQVGFDTNDRLERARDGAEAEAIGRALLSNALRHTLSGVRGGEPVFEVSEIRDGSRTGDALRFLSRGVVEPHGVTTVWEVSLAGGPDGVRLEARPIERDDVAPLVALLPHARAFDVQVRGRDAREGWLDTWVSPERSPVAVSITWLDAGGHVVPGSAPLIVRIGLEANP